jgi:predicted phage tail protein
VGQHWFYRVTAVDTSGNESGQSDPADATLTDVTPPAAPTGVAATGNLTGIQINWSANSESDLAGYRLLRASSSAGPFTAVNAALLTTTTFADTNVAAGAKWYYQVVAIDTTGNQSTVSSTVNATRPVPVVLGSGLQGDYYDNKDFTNKRFTRLDPKVAFYWGLGSPSSAIGANTFSVRWTGKIQPATSQAYTFTLRSDDGVRLWINGQLIIDKFISRGGIFDNVSTPISLSTNQKYDIKIEYFEATGNAGCTLSWQTATIGKTTVPTSALFPPGDLVPPAAVKNLAGSATPTSVTLSWTANIEPDLAGYNVYRSTSNSGSYAKLNATGPLTSATFSDTSLNGGTTYFYRVRAVDTSGNESGFTVFSIAVPIPSVKAGA